MLKTLGWEGKTSFNSRNIILENVLNRMVSHPASILSAYDEEKNRISSTESQCGVGDVEGSILRIGS